MATAPGWTPVADSSAWTPVAEEKPSAASRFASNAWEGANPVSLLSGMGESILHPLQAIKGYLKQNADLADKVEAALKRGDHGQALKHFGDLALQVIPGLGAQSDAAGEQISAGDVAGGLGKSTGAALGVVEASALPKVARGTAEAIHAVPGAAATVGRVVTNPEVIRKGVKVLPKGGALVEAYDTIKKAAARPEEAPQSAPLPAQPRPEPIQGPSVRPVEPPVERLTPAQIAALSTQEAKDYLAANLARRRPIAGQPSAEMLRRAGIPLSAEEEALAQHIMEGVEPEPKPIKPNVNPAEGERSGSNIISGLSHGEPGISITSDAPGSRLRRIVYRDTNGTPQGYLQFYLNDEQTAVAPKDHGLFPEVFVAPGARRTGIATQLYDAAKKNGFDLSGVSGTETTPAGAAFLNKRAGVAPVPPPADFESIPLQGPAQGNVIPIRPSESPIQPGISLPSGQGAAIPPEVPGLDAQRAFAEAMTGDPSGGQIPAPASPHPPAEAFEAAYRAKRAQVLADHFHANGISYEDLQHLTPGDLSSEQWEALLGKDPDTGVQFREPSQATIDQARVFLAGKSAAARSPKALAAAKELAGVGPKGGDVAPKADSAVEPAVPPKPVEVAAGAPKEPLTETMMRMARNDGAREQGAYTRLGGNFSGADIAEAPFYGMRRKFWLDIDQGTSFDDAFKKFDTEWRKYAEESNAKSQSGAKIKYGPSSGLYASGHRWVSPDKASSNIPFLKSMTSDVVPEAAPAPRVTPEPAAPSTPEPKPKARAKAKTKKISDLMNDTGGK